MKTAPMDFEERRPLDTSATALETMLAAERARWGRSWVEIHLDALRRNARRIGEAISPGRKLIVSVKKDGYGHGLPEVVRALSNLPALAGFGIATLEEGIVLRRSGCRQPVICFSVLEGETLAEAIRQDITLTVTCLEDARAADQAASQVGRPAHAHLKIDTGMGRLGRLGMETGRDIHQILALEYLRIDSFYSHLADAWDDPGSGSTQIRRMEDFRHDAALEAIPCHWGGADAMRLLDLLPDTAVLRMGIALYGDHPALPELEPVMTFKSQVIYRRQVPAGTKISYGGTFRTERPTELALVGAGYGNGVPRSLSGKGHVLIRGHRRPILGRVCMDQVAVDVTEIPEVRTGEEAVFFGRQGDRLLPAREVAAQAGTISYELFCVAGQLNPRRYVEG